ncbi:MAG: Nif3-like dinuclear metal center hexameric protein [Eubacterium sp.]|jgi:dinuclear metal center YbgI/SA1388 family protein
METREIYSLIDTRICSFDLAEDWDNSGIQIDSGRSVSKVLTALEATDDVIDEAIQKGAELIITHHPLIFEPLKRLSVYEAGSSKLMKLVKNGISVISAHTCYDKECLNADFGNALGFFPIDTENPYVMKAMLSRPVQPEELASFICGRLHIERYAVRIVLADTAPADTVAWCTGAGADFADVAYAEGAGIYITGDVKYHDARHAEEISLPIIDIGHYGSEKIFAQSFAKRFEQEVEGRVSTMVSASCRDPFMNL